MWALGTVPCEGLPASQLWNVDEGSASDVKCKMKEFNNDLLTEDHNTVDSLSEVFDSSTCPHLIPQVILSSVWIFEDICVF